MTKYTLLYYRYFGIEYRILIQWVVLSNKKKIYVEHFFVFNDLAYQYMLYNYVKCVIVVPPHTISDCHFNYLKLTIVSFPYFFFLFWICSISHPDNASSCKLAAVWLGSPEGAHHQPATEDSFRTCPSGQPTGAVQFWYWQCWRVQSYNGRGTVVERCWRKLNWRAT